jgi:hypothetical protein
MKGVTILRVGNLNLPEVYRYQRVYTRKEAKMSKVHVVQAVLDPDGPIEEVRATLIEFITTTIPRGGERAQMLTLTRTNDDYVRFMAKKMQESILKYKIDFGRPQ